MNHEQRLKNQKLYKRKRNEYMNEKTSFHKHYLWVAKFIGATEDMVPFNRKQLLTSTDEHMNDLPMKIWDSGHYILLRCAHNKGIGWSNCDTVCTLKTLAREIIKKTKNPPKRTRVYYPKDDTYNFKDDQKVYLGKSKYDEKIYLSGFKWQCGWYWVGGYIGNRNMHTHFNSCFLDTVDERGHCLGPFVSPWTRNKREGETEISNGCSIWEDITFFLTDVPEHISKNWWRIKDLYKQFYVYKEAAEAAKHGGHCSSTGRNKKEINPSLGKTINKHIEEVIIPEIIAIMNG
jgi:hypothetical protein